MAGVTSDGFDEFGNAGKLVWACTCGEGGVASQRGTAGAGEMLERDVGAHLHERGNDRHRVDVGRYLTSATLNPSPVPLVWHDES